MAQKPWGILLEPLVPLLLSKVHNSAGARGGLSTQSRVQGGFLLPRSIPWQHKRRSRLGESTAGLKIRSGLSKRDVFTLQYSTTEICSLGSTPLYVAFTCVSFEIHQLATSNVCSQFGFNYFQDPTFYCHTSETDHRSMFHTFTF